MHNKALVTCAVCGQDCDEHMHRKLNGDPICSACFRYLWPGFSTLVHHTPEVRDVCQFHKDFGTFDGQPLPSPVVAQKFRTTDGPRGFDYWEYEPGFKAISEGWVAWPLSRDAEPHGRVISLLEQADRGEVLFPCPVITLLGNTHSKEAFAMSIVIREEDEETFSRWLEGYDLTLRDFRTTFTCRPDLFF